ncbi:MAG TPA: phospholipase D-like domain-containing protein [Gaiellales bacterium]|jgi:phosphatidylserine/phosphatidylglycerophosphate/cardiolipin synthase-like enzyme|nr:phospholipase D-like domain-containing protein [Gaiellales bacterium]
MKTRLVVYANSDDALLLWATDVLDDTVHGFAVQRRLEPAGGGASATSWLDNFAPPGPQPFQGGQHQPSNLWPFRSFTWTDHSVSRGGVVSYRVAPVLSDPADPSKLRPPKLASASSWSKKRTIGAKSTTPYETYFNRGFVISQFISRYLAAQFPGLAMEQALARFKDRIGKHDEDVIRAFLSGELRTTMLRLLADARAQGDEVHAALYELSDDELIKGLAALKAHAHVVLANGSIQAAKGEPAAEARKRDQNADGRAALVKAGVDVEQTHRFVSPGALAHNKFLVFSHAGIPERVWTGSTNWTPTGLCTQLNNGLLISDRAAATAYLAQWHALRDAHSSHPASLVNANALPHPVGPAGHGDTVRFTRAPKKADLAELAAIVAGAGQGVLFLMFMPGGTGVLKNVRDLIQARPALLVRGVVSDLPLGRKDEQTGTTTKVSVTLIDTAGEATVPAATTYDVVQPGGMRHPAAGWAAEVTRQQFKQGIGFAIIHSKVLVVDPFGDDPVVVTGSHNFSPSASTGNDENFMVVRGDRALAEAYAVNVESAWRHYAARVGNPFHNLSGIAYLRALQQAQVREQVFWRLGS